MHHLRYYMNGLFAKYLRHKELDDLYISAFIKNLSQAFISIFIPIYLLTLGFTLEKIIIFFAIAYLAILVLYAPSLKLGSIIGIKKVMAIGTLIWIPSYLLLNQIPNGFPYQIVALLFGIGNSIYWGCFHVEFTKSAEANKEAEEYSIYRILIIIASVLGPLIGAYLISLASYSILFIVASALAFISIIPLFFTKDIYTPKEKLSLKGIFKSDSKTKFLGYTIEGFLTITGSLLWPLFIYMILNSVLNLGQIFSLGALIVSFLIVEIGKLADKYPKKIFRTSVLAYAPFWIIRIFAKSPIAFFVINLIVKIVGSSASISMNRLAYHEAEKRKKVTSYFMFREIGLSLGKIGCLILVFLIGNIPYVFAITSIVTLGYLFVANKSGKEVAT